MAGVVALMKAVCPTLTPTQLDGALSSGAITSDLGAGGRDDVFGHGLIDALAAVQWANDPAHCTGSTPPPAVTTISATPARADFAPGGGTSATITLVTSGNDPVTGVTVTGKPSWLTITSPGGTGIGAYTLVANPSGLGDGVYSANLTFAAAPIGRSVVVPVTLRVGAVVTGGDAGYVYILLLSSVPDGQGTLAAVKQAQTAPVNGEYAFSFTGVPAGKYYLVAGTDSNDDGLICDAGESCGAYPTLAQPVEIDPASPPADLRFQVGFTSGLGGAGAGGQGGLIPPGGVRLLPALKASAVTP
jgi:serine protease